MFEDELLYQIMATRKLLRNLKGELAKQFETGEMTDTLEGSEEETDARKAEMELAWKEIEQLATDYKEKVESIKEKVESIKNQVEQNLPEEERIKISGLEKLGAVSDHLGNMSDVERKNLLNGNNSTISEITEMIAEEQNLLVGLGSAIGGIDSMDETAKGDLMNEIEEAKAIASQLSSRIQQLTSTAGTVGAYF